MTRSKGAYSEQIAFFLLSIAWRGIILTVLIPGITGHAQVPTAIVKDGTLGTQVQKASDGITYNITGGTRPGDGPNLFHSFSQFDVEAGDIANFLNETRFPTDNILSRVTGDSPSNIFGKIKTMGFPEANLFLMNPSGVLIGPTASLEISGSFHVTTADYLRLTDNIQFNALPGSSDILLTSAPVAAFGFLGPNAAEVTVDQSNLQVPEKKFLSIVAGDIDIAGDFSFDTGRLKAPGGKVNIGSVASGGEFIVETLEQGPNVNGENFENLGNVSLSKGAGIDTSGNGAGAIVIRSGQLVVDFSDVFADNEGNLDGNGQGIDINVIDNVILDNGFVTTDVKGNGKGGDIRIVTNSLSLLGTPDPTTIDPQALIGSRSDAFETGATGASGNIEVTASNFRIEGQAELTTGTFSKGDAGDIVVQADKVVLSGTSPFLTGIFSNALSISESGKAGNIRLNAGDVEVTNKAAIQARTQGQGNGGTLTIEAETLKISEGGFFRTSTSSSGDGGNINVTVEDLTISQSGSIQAESTSVEENSGSAGNINLTAEDTILVNNGTVTTRAQNAVAGDIKFVAKSLIQVIDSDIISEVPEGSGSAGRINIDPQFIVVQGSLIDSSADFGDGGDVTFVANSAILIDPFSTIDTSSQFGGNGTVDIRAPIQNLSESIAPLPEALIKIAALFAARCAAQKGGNFSSFVPGGFGGAPPGFSGHLPSPLTFSQSTSGSSTSIASRFNFDDKQEDAEWTFFDAAHIEDLAQRCSSAPAIPS